MFRVSLAAPRALACPAFVFAIFLSVASSAQSLSHRPDTVFHDRFEGITAGPFTDADAARFLTQATFGPTAADIAHLRSIGYQAWLTEQFAATPTYEMTYINWTEGTPLGSPPLSPLGERPDGDHRIEAWWLGALGGPDPQYPTDSTHDHKDQLRQRVAFALSEIMVVSQQNATLAGFQNGLAYYYDILSRDAFGNYRTLLQDVTLSPEMGVYLNMQSNQRADLSQNIHPDENYAREINQLFSVGLVMLNADGTPKAPSQPTYTQSTVSAFAHVFTGWSFYDCDANGYDNFSGCGPDYNTGASFQHPMIAYDVKNYPHTGDPSYHDNGTDPVNDLSNKQLLIYPGAASAGVLANGGTAASDLQFALDNIFNHPNVGPFISKQLIQRLVTSNPTPAYVGRVAAIFNNDGTGVRGNLKAVVQKILLDPEARVGQWQNPDTYGKLREPLLVFTHVWRAMGAKHMCGNDQDQPNPGNPDIIYKYNNQPYRYAGYGGAWNTQYWVGQMPLNANTVFNFFKPGFIPGGEMAAAGLYGPEFQTTTDTTITDITGNSFQRGFGGDISDTCDPTDDYGDVQINHAQDVALAGSSTGGTADPSDRLVDAYNIRFMGGQMSPFMRQTLISYLNTLSTANSGSDDFRVERIKRALGLILTSPEYIIQK
ncbi:DUF1800 family protein [Pseudolysobacter antarcticus]|uniref:DUF1800 family protein n=1 Tax=Pseudolysobacter antarcticus TaxID=2511995 RepID=A0A411HHQ0_9GAMM|nr:DUF1800 family protein [Pseudolysobacter antarcticus]